MREKRNIVSSECKNDLLKRLNYLRRSTQVAKQDRKQRERGRSRGREEYREREVRAHK